MIWQHFKAQLEEKWNEASRLTSSSLMEMKSSGCCLDRRLSMSCAVVLSLASTSTREPALGSAFSGVSADGGRLLCAHLLFLGATCERHLLFLNAESSASICQRFRLPPRALSEVRPVIPSPAVLLPRTDNDVQRSSLADSVPTQHSRSSPPLFIFDQDRERR